MATTANTAVLAAPLYDDAVIPVSASGVGGLTATKGDWIGFSANWAIPLPDGALASPAHRISAAGVALQNNPTFTPQGVAINNTAFAVARRGVMRVSASASATARTIPIGSFAFPSTTSSGIVGQTGATGLGPLWLTAGPVSISGSIGALTGLNSSGVAIVINHPVGGVTGAGQLDIAFNLATNAPWI